MCRIIAALNYDGQQTLVTPQSFAKPNFTLVYDLLLWFARILVGKPDDLSTVAYSIEDDSKKAARELSESIAVESLINLGRLFYSRLGIQVNLVQLYRADTGCCVELLRIAKPIYEAVESFVNEPPKSMDLGLLTKTLAKNRAEMEATLIKLNDHIGNDQAGKRDLTARISDQARQLETLLENEQKFSEERQRVIDKSLQLADIERILMANREGIIKQTEELARSNEELRKDLIRVDERLKAKEVEVDHSIERLNDLLMEAPQYLKQYEKLYKDYETSYDAYVSKHRNLEYLKSCVYSPEDNNDSLFTDGYDDDRFGYQLDEAAANPLGSTAGDPLDGAALAGGFRTDGLPPSTTGPARLAESLPDEGSKPISASLGVDGSGAAVGAAVGLKKDGAAAADPELTATGRRDTTVDGAGRRTYVGRPTVAGDKELDGLLKEFVADSELEYGLYETDGDTKLDDEDGSTEDEEPDGTSDDGDP